VNDSWLSRNYPGFRAAPISREGVSVIDRGEGDTPAKRDFANHEHSFYRGLWTSGGIRSLPARAALALIWRLG